MGSTTDKTHDDSTTKETTMPPSSTGTGKPLSPVWVKAWLAARLLGGPAAATLVIAVILGGGVSSFTAFTIALAAVYGLTVLSLSLLERHLVDRTTGPAGDWRVHRSLGQLPRLAP